MKIPTTVLCKYYNFKLEFAIEDKKNLQVI